MKSHVSLKSVSCFFVFCFCIVQIAWIVYYGYKGEFNLKKIVSFFKYNPTSRTDNDRLFVLLDDLDITIRKKAPASKIYGNIYNARASQQAQSYISAIKDFQVTHPIRTICEIGFAGGHSATVFLHSTDSASYTGFDMWDQAIYEDTAIDWVRKQFKDRNIVIIKGDSTKTVLKHQGTCDLIHIDGAHHANYPITDMKNMVRLASVNNLLLIDDCTKSWPAVLNGVDYLKKNDLVGNIEMHIADGWKFRGAQKGWCIGSYKKIQATNTPVPKQITFLGKTFCSPSWYGTECDSYSYKRCSNLSDECFYNNVTGVLSVSCERWQSALSLDEAKYDTKAINRNEDHAKSFDFYKSLPNDLGNVIELSAGPFTQSQTILRDKNAKSITIVESMAFHFITHINNCFYKNGSFKNLPTTLLSMPTEKINNTRKFDTLVMVNVLERVYDALSILNSAVNLIKDNGLFIWHERIWDNYRGTASFSSDHEFQLHPIRIKTAIANQVMSAFEEVYVSWKTGENQGVYFIGRKRSGKLTTDIPQHQSCFNQTTGKQTIIFFVSNENHTVVENQLQTVKKTSNVKSVILILTESLRPEVMSSLLNFDNIKTTISHHHLENWSQEVGFYTTPCSYFIPGLTPAILDGTGTLCVGTGGVTVILMGYSTRRLPNYDSIIPAYIKTEIIEKIILIWNNKIELFPKKFVHPKITFINPKVNSMNNRFNVSDYIKTGAVLLIDDDVIISEKLLTTMFLKWSENRDRLVGINTDKRYVTKDNEYSVYGKNPSITIGKTMLFHRKYIDQYMNDKNLVEWNKDKFCEDISMNGVIFKATKLKPLFMPQTSTNYRRNLPEIDGASISKKNWGQARTNCVRFVMQYFNIDFK